MLDQKALDNLRALQRMGASDVLRKVIDTYLKSSPKLLQALRDAVDQEDDAEALRQAAHSLKSSSANVGAAALVELCRQLEEIGGEDRMAGAAEVVSEIEKTYPSVCELLVAESEKPAA